MAGLHARGGDRPVDGTLQHLKGEGASTPPQRWITSTERTERARRVLFKHGGLNGAHVGGDGTTLGHGVDCHHTRWRPFEGFVHPLSASIH